jgi:dihydroxyacetone kinase-like protein
MTGYTMNTQQLIELLKQVCSDMKSRIEELRELDAVVGDGDLGVTMELGSTALFKFLETTEETDAGKLLAACGMNFNKASPSTFGTLLASAFLGAGQAVKDKQELRTDDLLSAGKGAIDGIKKRGKADVGDKTMLDALVPAFEAFEKDYKSTGNLEQALDTAVTAAEAGMKSTIDMKAKYGRASWHQEKTIGVQDAGATAMYYLIEAFARNLKQIN